MMKNIKNIFTLLVMALIGLSLTGCSEDDLSTNQFGGGVSLKAYGPNPVMRGGMLRFVGSNLDQVASINIPGVGDITTIEVIKSGVPSEIRVNVPKDGPEKGFVTLKTKSGEAFTTLSQLYYIEGIEINAIIPDEVMPGDVIKIEGDYLNLIKSMAFANGVLVSATAFQSQGRYAIEVAVPEEAQTGKLEFYTEDLTIERTAKEEDELSYQTIQSEDMLTVGLPPTTKIASPRGTAEAQGTITAKAGETITLTGTHYNVVKAIVFGSVEVEEFTVSEDAKTLSFTLPAEAPDGEFALLCKSGIEAPVATLTTVKPSGCKANPTPVKAGKNLVIEGNDMDLVASVRFADANGEYTISSYSEDPNNSSKCYFINVPDNACEGNLQLVMTNGDFVEVPFTLVKPVVTTYNANPVSAGAALQMTGTDLDLVKSVTFGEATADVEATETSLTVTVPMAGTSGKPKLNLANGTQVEAPELNINEAVFCYATALPSEEEELKAGNAMTLTVANGDKLTNVQMNGENCQWILTGEDKNQLIIGIPESAKANSELRLISSNGEISYNIAVIPATSVNKVVWSGLTQLTWSDGGRVMIPAAAFEGVPEGAVLTVAYSQVDQQWDQAQFNYGNWSGINFNQPGEGMTTFNQTLVPTDVYGWFTDGILNRETSMILTQEILNNIQALKGGCEGQDNCGIIIQGSGLTFSKVSISYEISLEQDITGACMKVSNDTENTEFPVTLSWSNDNSKIWIYRDKDPNISQMNLKAGSSKIIFYTEGTGQLQLNNPNWSAYTTLEEWNDPSAAAREVILTQEMIDWCKGVTSDQWGTGRCFVIQGDGMIVKKITIFP